VKDVERSRKNPEQARSRATVDVVIEAAAQLLEAAGERGFNTNAVANFIENLDKVPEKGCLIAIGYPKFAGGLGGYARYIAICPADWKYGVSVGEVAEAPLPKSDKILQWDNKLGIRVRK